MSTLLVILLLVSLIAIVVGLVKPGLVLRWGEKKTRPRVLKIYGGLFILLFIAFGIVSPKQEEGVKLVVEQPMAKIEGQQKVVQAKPEENKVGNKEPELKYTQIKARERVDDWCRERQFPNNPQLSIIDGSTDEKYEVVSGQNYHSFGLMGLRRAVGILVDPYTGDLFYYEAGSKDNPEPLDTWYLNYTASHKGNIPQANVRISENFEWVEMHSVQGRYIVGKVKNISNRTLECRIEFNLYDKDLNQIGVVVDNIKNLKAGNTWAFKVYMDKSNVEKYQFDGIRYW